MVKNNHKMQQIIKHKGNARIVKTNKKKHKGNVRIQKVNKKKGINVGIKKSSKGVPVKYLRKYFPILADIASATTESKRNKLINALPNTGIDTYCEYCYNLLFSNKIRKASIPQLKEKIPLSVKGILRYLALAPKSKHYETKRKFMKQSGGSIIDVLTTILPLLITLI